MTSGMTRAGIGIVFAVLALGLAAASADGQAARPRSANARERVPVWWKTPPVDTQSRCIRARAVAPGQDLALEKAISLARDSIAAEVEAQWQALLGSIRSEDPRLPASPGISSDVEFKNTRVAKQAAFRRGKKWSAFVFLVYPDSLVPSLLLDRLRSNAEWYAAVRGTSAVQLVEAPSR
jgi:hypothetical protein